MPFNKCPMCGYNESVNNTLNATVMNKFVDNHGNIAVFNKPNDVETFTTPDPAQPGQTLTWKKVALKTNSPKSNAVVPTTNQSGPVAQAAKTPVSGFSDKDMPTLATPSVAPVEVKPTK